MLFVVFGKRNFSLFDFSSNIAVRFETIDDDNGVLFSSFDGDGDLDVKLLLFLELF